MKSVGKSASVGQCFMDRVDMFFVPSRPLQYQMHGEWTLHSNDKTCPQNRSLESGCSFVQNIPYVVLCQCPGTKVTPPVKLPVTTAKVWNKDEVQPSSIQTLLMLMLLSDQWSSHRDDRLRGRTCNKRGEGKQARDGWERFNTCVCVVC